MTEPRWLTRRMIESFHDDQLRTHLGLPGIRDENLLESALARPQQKWHYGERDLTALAAAYGFGLASNHPFVDGNKRAAFVALATFLRINGLRLRTPEEDVVREILALAAGERSETELADWIRSRTEVVARVGSAVPLE
jgi:death-on-curing protein